MAGQDLNSAVAQQIGTLSPLTLSIILAAGLVTSLSPCTLSVLPLTIGYIGGYSKDGDSQFLLLRALSFYAGLVSSLSILGVASSLLGRAYGQFGNGLPIGVSLIAILMGLNLLEVYPIQLPSIDVDVRRFGFGPNAQAYLAGVTFAFAASPCSTPVLVTLLAYVSSAQDPILGVVYLTTYTTGFIAPLLIAATATVHPSLLFPKRKGELGSIVQGHEYTYRPNNRGRRPYRNRGGYENPPYDSHSGGGDSSYAIQEYDPNFGHPYRNSYPPNNGGRRPYSRPRPRGRNYRNDGDSGFYRNDRDRGRYSRGHASNWNDSYGPTNRYNGGPRRYQGNRDRIYRPRDYQNRWHRSGRQSYDNRSNTFRMNDDEILPKDLSWCCDLEAHSSTVNCLDFDEESGKLFSGGSDGLVRQWNAETGQVEHSVSYNGEITAILVNNNYLFVAVHCTQDETGNQGIQSGDIHIYNLEVRSEQKFVAHMGRIFALHVTNDVLFSAGEDKMIKGWKFNSETKLFDNAGSFESSQGQGHITSIQCLTTLGTFLFSGDCTGAIAVWNMQTGRMQQILRSGHNASVSSMLCWKGTLITGSLDHRISVWNLNLQPNVPQVIQTPPTYHSEAKNAGGFPCEVLSLCGVSDGAGNPVLVAGLATNELVLYNLPSFTLKGRIKDAPFPSALAFATESCLFVGLGSGTVRVYVWENESTDENAMALT